MVLCKLRLCMHRIQIAYETIPSLPPPTSWKSCLLRNRFLVPKRWDPTFRAPGNGLVKRGFFPWTTGGMVTCAACISWKGFACSHGLVSDMPWPGAGPRTRAGDPWSRGTRVRKEAQELGQEAKELGKDWGTISYYGLQHCLAMPVDN